MVWNALVKADRPLVSFQYFSLTQATSPLGLHGDLQSFGIYGRIIVST
jgi:hypothetical protein